ncbi:MAG: hypothetical protein GQ578_08730 [Desulfuromonadaceae bacterium]|nr:hypothetical protein [Desulfuromonadaceae bacterium]
MSSVTLQEEWSEKIVAWRESSLSVAAWCRDHAENYHRFLYWRKRLAMPVIQQPGRFVELELAAPPLALSCNGVYVHVASGFDGNLLGEVLTVLKRV